MRLKIILFTASLFLFISTVSGVANNVLSNGQLSGKVTDKVTGELLTGVSIYFPNLKTGTITQSDGTYMIDQLPSTKLI